jgi:hypothetical protein
VYYKNPPKTPYPKQQNKNLKMPVSTINLLDSSPYAPIMLCDETPLLDGILNDMSFKSHSADVPEDLLLCTPQNGWDTPASSPVTVPLSDSYLFDPLLTEAAAQLFEEDYDISTGMTSSFPSKMRYGIDKVKLESVFEWTPPASPLSDVGSEEALLSCLNPCLPACPPSSLSSAAPKTGIKRKYEHAVTSTTTTTTDEVRENMRRKSEQERAARTAACEIAVQELAHQKNSEDPLTKRHMHNILERKRRNELKNSYEMLRENIPSLEDNERASTGQILLNAVDFINQLKKEQSTLASTLAQMKERNAQLKKTLGHP